MEQGWIPLAKLSTPRPIQFVTILHGKRACGLNRISLGETGTHEHGPFQPKTEPPGLTSPQLIWSTGDKTMHTRFMLCCRPGPLMTLEFDKGYLPSGRKNR